LVAACQEANQDIDLERDIEDWQAFHDDIGEEGP
jgi:hypothetical protein